MDLFLSHYCILLDALSLYWAEMIGALLLALMINLFRSKGTQKDSFSLISIGFYIVILRDFFYVFLHIFHSFGQESTSLVMSTDIIPIVFTSLTSVFLVVAAFKNLRFYFSSKVFLSTLSLILITITIGLPFFEPLDFLAPYLPPVYFTLALFILGFSFYSSTSNQQNVTVRAVGNGFFVLTLCYGYQLFNLVENTQQVLLLGYMITIVLSLAAQIQFLNHSNEQLEFCLENERKSRRDAWEISPSPIVISRLRDDAVVYMNPTAREVLGLQPNEVFRYTLSQYFIDSKKREELLSCVRQNKIVNNFEVEVHHPKKNSGFWIDMTTRTTDYDEEIVLFTTFKDITDQKRKAQLLKEQASTDPLTGLNNRRQFEVMVTQALHVAERYRQPFSVLMLDIDFFKQVNDTYGHEAGDAVLINLAKTFKEALRKSDIIARYGGEEFVAFLPHTTPAEAKIAAEHLREVVETMHTFKNGKNIPITISVGISDHQINDLEKLISQADKALYYSKENGRNQVSLYREIKNKR